MDDLLAGYPVVVVQDVVWGEMDAYQHVNNVVYFRYFENARLAYIEQIGWPAIEEQTGVGPILAATTAKFRKPLEYPDTIGITARLKSIEEDRFVLEHHIISNNLQTIVTEGTGTVVSYHYESESKVPLTPQLMQGIEAVEMRVR